MIFSKLFKKKDKTKQNQKLDQSEYASLQSEYASVQTENIVQELKLSDKAQAKNYVVDLCEQMIDASRDLEEARDEYQLVTDYLMDVQLIEDMEGDTKKEIVACATRVAELEEQRTDFLKTEKKLSDAQYAQMQEDEENLPGTITRLKANETDLDAIKKDMSYLEGKKLEWSMQKTNAVRTQKMMRKSAYYLFAVFATLMALLAVVSWYFKIDLRLPITIIAIIAVVMGGYILIRTQNASRDIKQAEVNYNHAVSVENHVKIKFVNVKNAVDFICEKYHVRNSYELQFLYEQYQAEEREKEKFRKTNDELERCSRALVDVLMKLHMYDAKIWVNYARAIVDSRELVELKHELITRRQKIRSRIEYSITSINDMKQEALKNMDQLGSSRPQIEQIIHKIEMMTATE